MATRKVSGATDLEIPGYTDFVEIGHGGFSRVYKARQTEFNRFVAIKVLDNPLRDDAAVDAFEQECRTMGALWDHPNIVPVYASAFTSDERPCIVMKLFHEGSYFQVLHRSGPIPVQELLRVGAKICSALAAAHDADIIHGDVKPHNIFKSRYGEPALGDFGIATFVGQHSAKAPKGLSLHYSAPDLVDGEPGPKADQYSLAATIYTLAVGKRPFELEGESGNNAKNQVLLRVLAAETPQLPYTFPQHLRTVIRRAMDRNPELRFDNLNELGEAFSEIEYALSSGSQRLAAQPSAEGLVAEIKTAQQLATSRTAEVKVCITCGTSQLPWVSQCVQCAAHFDQWNNRIETIPQPQLGKIAVSGGRTENLDTDLLVGRRPDTKKLEPHQRAIVVGEGDRSVSRRHVELRLNSWALEAHIFGKNTRLEHLGYLSELPSGTIVDLVEGDTLYFGVDSSLQYTAGFNADSPFVPIQRSNATPSTVGSIEFSESGMEALDADLIIGRNPTRQNLEPHQRPVVHGGDDRRISRRHLEIKRTEPHPTAICLGKVFGLERSGFIQEIHSGESAQLQPDDILRYGNKAWLRYHY